MKQRLCMFMGVFLACFRRFRDCFLSVVHRAMKNFLFLSLIQSFSSFQNRITEYNYKTPFNGTVQLDSFTGKCAV